jgi:uncharacterized protein YyaL (SSP411 family)
VSEARGGSENRLARESSPYLLLHAHNPVDWYPWGEEAFAEARRADKPIFLSVGYSTCYWCHVMERECFSNPEIARQLNNGFVSIKLDREERPDLDEIYMTATQLLTRSGGWPNSVFLTPDLKPFFAGTYFPPRDAPGRPGFPRLLASIREAWDQRRPSILEQAEAVVDAIEEQMTAAPAGRRPGGEAVRAVGEMLARRFDPEWGGFGGAPKFPSPSNLFFLLDRAREGDGTAQQMLVVTLDAMARGGIHDQLAGGFHRYSTDAEWLVPHFEKMLYDNAALAALYAEAAPFDGGRGFARVARRTLDFVLAELTGEAGAFLSAIDAETDGHEGAYYTWTPEELQRLLDAGSRELLGAVYGFDGAPNFEGGRYVFHLPRPLAEQAKRLGVTVEQLLERLEPGRKALLAERSQRKRPLTDDKVLADWNGLMIGAMARAGALLGEARYQRAAAQAAEFVLRALVDGQSGGLLHAYRNGAAKVPALLDDYAFLIQGLLELHAATGEARWLVEARRLAAEQDRRLWDDDASGYFTAGADPRLLVRSKAAYDGAVASGNGIAALNLVTLAERTGDAGYRERCRHLLETFGKGIEEWPLAHATLVRAVARLAPDGEPEALPAPIPPGGALETEAQSVVSIRTSLGEAGGSWRPFSLELAIRPGWHLNAHPASLPSLVATELHPSRGALRSLRYPPGEVLRLGFAEDVVSVYSGRVRLEGEIEVRAGETPAVRLTYQPCDDSRCLVPTTREVVLR